MKRLLCTILALALCLALAAPAMAEKINNDEYVELEWYCRLDPVKPGVDDVMEVFNQYLMDQGLNCKVNAHFFPAADYTQKMSTMVSAGQELDFLHLGNVFPFVQNAQDEIARLSVEATQKLMDYKLSDVYNQFLDSAEGSEVHDQR